MAAREEVYVQWKWHSGIYAEKLMAFLPGNCLAEDIAIKSRIYADTPESKIRRICRKMKRRIDEQGYTWLKMDLGIHLVDEYRWNYCKHEILGRTGTV